MYRHANIKSVIIKDVKNTALLKLKGPFVPFVSQSQAEPFQTAFPPEGLFPLLNAAFFNNTFGIT